MINSNFKIKKFTKPFPFIIFENFFDKYFFYELEKNFPSVDNLKKANGKVGRFDYDISYQSDLYKNLIQNSAYKKLHNYIHSKSFINFFISFFKEDLLNEFKKKNLAINIKKIKKVDFPVEGIKSTNIYNLYENNEKFLYPRLDFGTGLKNYGKVTGGGGIHIDNPQRLISILIYFGGYKTIKGGEHRIWKNNNNDFSLFKSIPPKKNTVIASVQTNSAFHDVNPIQEINGQRNIAYSSISCNSPIWEELQKSDFNKKYRRNRIKKNFFEKCFDYFYNVF